jgi:hypothetical protein
MNASTHPRVGRLLSAGDYVVMRGSLWQEHSHDGRTRGTVGQPRSWRLVGDPSPDRLMRVLPPGRNVRLTTSTFRLLTLGTTGPAIVDDRTIPPEFSPSTPVALPPGTGGMGRDRSQLFRCHHPHHLRGQLPGSGGDSPVRSRAHRGPTRTASRAQCSWAGPSVKPGRDMGERRLPGRRHGGKRWRRHLGLDGGLSPPVPR